MHKKNNVNGRAQIYRVKANTQAGNTRVKVMTTQKGQYPRYLPRDLKNLRVFPENSTEGPVECIAGVTHLSLRIHSKS